jgi:SAM-dependent methyltransferase
MGSLKDKARNYAQAFNGASQLADETIRARKADKIRAVLENERILPNKNLKILDIGCSYGLILKQLAADVDYGVGVDYDMAGLQRFNSGVGFACADAERLPFAAGSFDIVICNHVYEHTDNPERMLDEIERVLAPDGVCYFAGPNKYDLIEPHYGLPFLSWLPSSLADRYLRLTGKGNRYVEKPYSYRDLVRLLARFRVEDYTGRIVTDPARFHATDVLPHGSLKQIIAKVVLRFIPFLFPGFIWVIRKSARQLPEVGNNASVIR